MTGTAARPGGADLATDLDGGLRAGGDVDDDELVLGRLDEGLVRVGGLGDRVPRAGQDLGCRLARGGIRREQQDGTGGHALSPVGVEL
jgi:hypothetical protein